MTCFLTTCQPEGFLFDPLANLLLEALLAKLVCFAAISRASNYMPFFSFRSTKNLTFLPLAG
jgi:hypothetical protein